MSDFKSKKNILIFACGNPSRGDDALGPLFLNHLKLQVQQLPNADQIELLTDFQFQVEHAMDLNDRKKVIFVDACMSTKEPYEFRKIAAAKDTSYTTHSMSPAAVLDVYQQMYKEPPPACYLLSISGESFELGDSLSASAEHNLEQSLEFLKNNLT